MHELAQMLESKGLTKEEINEKLNSSVKELIHFYDQSIRSDDE